MEALIVLIGGLVAAFVVMTKSSKVADQQGCILGTAITITSAACVVMIIVVTGLAILAMEGP